MNRIIVIALGILTLVGCKGNQNAPNDTIVKEPEGGNYLGERIVVFGNDSVPFFGKTIFMDDSAHIMQQIKAVAEHEELLSVDDKVLTIGDVGFGINLHDASVVLISSTQVDDPKVKPIVKYLNSLYGVALEDEPDNYWWHTNCPNDSICYNTIRLRPLHSEEGGTVIMFY